MDYLLSSPLSTPPASPQKPSTHVSVGDSADHVVPLPRAVGDAKRDDEPRVISSTDSEAEKRSPLFKSRGRKRGHGGHSTGGRLAKKARFNSHNEAAVESEEQDERQSADETTHEQRLEEVSMIVCPAAREGLLVSRDEPMPGQVPANDVALDQPGEKSPAEEDPDMLGMADNEFEAVDERKPVERHSEPVVDSRRGTLAKPSSEPALDLTLEPIDESPSEPIVESPTRSPTKSSLGVGTQTRGRKDQRSAARADRNSKMAAPMNTEEHGKADWEDLTAPLEATSKGRASGGRRRVAPGETAEGPEDTVNILSRNQPPTAPLPSELDPQPSVTRSSAGRRPAPKKHDSESDGDVEPIARKHDHVPVGKKKQPLRGNWSADHLMQNAKSKLKDIDLEKFLLHPKAWESLTCEQQKQLVSMLPNTSPSEANDEEQVPSIPAQRIKTNDSLRSSIRLFQEDLAAGHYEPKWIQDAVKASQKRANGSFDSWKEKNLEQFWGQKQRVLWTAIAGDSAQWSLQDLVKEGLFRAGDVWLLRRAMRKGSTFVCVEKEARITGVNEDHSLNFSFPPGQHKHSSPANGLDITFNSVTNPSPLASRICAEDGRIPADHRSPNTWREIRCSRKNQDMGALWDIRELHHTRAETGQESAKPHRSRKTARGRLSD